MNALFPGLQNSYMFGEVEIKVTFFGKSIGNI